MPKCPLCSGALGRAAVPPDQREQAVCSACGFVFYLNPKVVAGTIPEQDGRVLLTRRAINPGRGLWTFPGGASDNRLYFGPHVRFAPGIDEAAQMLLFDPQTSGGLLLAVPPAKLKALLARARLLAQQGLKDRAEADVAAAEKLTSGDPRAWVRHGLLLARARSFEAADRAFARAAALAGGRLAPFIEAGWLVAGPYPEDLRTASDPGPTWQTANPATSSSSGTRTTSPASWASTASISLVRSRPG